MAESPAIVRKILAKKDRKRQQHRTIAVSLANLADEQKASNIRINVMMTIIAGNNHTSINATPVIRPIVTNEEESLMNNPTLVDTAGAGVVGVGLGGAADSSPMEVDTNPSDEKKSSSIEPNKTDDVSFINVTTPDYDCTHDTSNNIVVDSKCTTLINRNKKT